MRGKSQHRLREKLTRLFACLLSIVIFYYLSVTSLPALAGGLQELAVLSASITFLQGGVSAPRQSISEELITAKGEQTGQTAESAAPEPEPSQGESASEASSMASEVSLPERPEKSGDVVRQTLVAGNHSAYVSIGTGTVRNLSGLTAKQIQTYAKDALPRQLTDTEEPQVLIYHTHATESYQPYFCDWYDLSYNARSKDNEKNMIAVGNVLEEKLKTAGIGVIHDTTQHDNPSYSEGYDRSRQTVKNYLKKYPSIKVVLDVHRDAIQGDHVITAPYTEIQGKKTAQIMTICGADNGTDRLPKFIENFKFAAALQNQAEKDYPTLMRPMLFDKARFYNQDLSTGALLLEIGGHGNTLEEAKNAMSFLADSLITVLKG